MGCGVVCRGEGEEGAAQAVTGGESDDDIACGLGPARQAFACGAFAGEEAVDEFDEPVVGLDPNPNPAPSEDVQFAVVHEVVKA